MPFLNADARERKELFEGIDTRTFWGEKMLVSLVEVQPGAAVPMHSHPHEQVGIILKGSITMTLDGESRELKVGDMYLAEGGLEHGGKAGDEGCTAAEIFSPVREEYRY